MLSRQTVIKLMNMKFIIIILFAFASIIGSAQEKKKEVQPIKSVSVEKNVATKTLTKENKAIYVSSGTNSAQPEKTLEYYDNLIMALNAKIEYIKSDEAENAKALESGWFDKMDQVLLNAKADRTKLQNQKK